jgi:hypothetical protein
MPLPSFFSPQMAFNNMFSSVEKTINAMFYGAMPVKMKACIIVGSPWWMSALLRLMKLFMSKKMSKRIVSASLAVRASLHRARAARVCVTALASLLPTRTVRASAVQSDYLRTRTTHAAHHALDTRACNNWSVASPPSPTTSWAAPPHTLAGLTHVVEACLSLHI